MMRRSPALPKSLLLLFWLLAFAVVAWGGIAQIIRLPGAANESNSLGVGLSLFVFYFAELCLVAGVSCMLLQGGKLARRIAYSLCVGFVLIHALQWASLAQVHTYLPRIAIENAESVHLLLSAERLIGGLCFFVLIAFVVYWIESRSRPALGVRTLRVLVGCCLGITLLCLGSNLWIPAKIATVRNQLLSKHGLPHTSPIAALAATIFPIESNQSHVPGWVAHLEVTNTFGYTYNRSADFPLVREKIYQGDSPYPRRENAAERPDILIFFVEGFSASPLSFYGGTYEGLNPNLAAFASESMRVEKYFSHTSATYRGLHGQICSLFPFYGGIGGWIDDAEKILDKNYHCLTNVAHDAGYETVFLDSGLSGSPLNMLKEMMTSLSFDEFWSAQELVANDLGEGATPHGAGWLSDHQVMSALVHRLRSEVPSDGQRAPRLTAVYTVGTHAFLDIDQDGKLYGSGDNLSLNTIHSFDAAFGVFWEEFRQSDHARTTVVIVTADHAHFPEPAFIEIAGDDYRPWFVGQIPLLIYDPTREIPKTYDANYRSSVDLAPSLAHLLDLPNQPTSFLGRSIFEPGHRATGIGAAAQGGQTFVYDADGTHYFRRSETRQREGAALKRFTDDLSILELENRIWPDESADESN